MLKRLRSFGWFEAFWGVCVLVVCVLVSRPPTKWRWWQVLEIAIVGLVLPFVIGPASKKR